MDRYEYKVKFQEINNLIDEKEYFEAAAIADTIDWEKKPVETLVRIGDLYRKVMRYDDAIELLRLAIVFFAVYGRREAAVKIILAYIENIELTVDVEKIHVFDKETEQAICH